MGIISRFTDIMSANMNAAISRAEEKNADKLLQKYLEDAKEDLNRVKAETAAVIAEEMACGRRLSDCESQIEKYEKYAAAAVQSGNDGDARKFLSYKLELSASRPQLLQDCQSAKESSEKMRQMTAKLTEDIKEAQNKIRDLQSKLTVAKAQEKNNDLTQQLGGVDQFNSLFDKVQKRVDTAQATADMNNSNSEMEELESKYQEKAKGNDSVEQELERLKNCFDKGE